MRMRNRLALMVAGGLVLTVSAVATLVRDSAVEEQLEALLARSLAAPCDFDSAHISFLEGLTVRGLRILDPMDPLRGALVEVDKARIDFHLGLFGSGPRITMIVLQSPTVRLRTNAENTLTLATLAAPGDGGAPAIHPPAIRVFDGTVIVEGEPFLLPGSSTTVRNVRADFVPSDGTLRIPEGHAVSDLLGEFEFTMDVRPGERMLATIDIAECDLSTLRDSDLPKALTDILRRFEIEGRASVTARHEQRGDAPPALGFTAHLSDVRTTVSIAEHEGLPAPQPIAAGLRRATVELADARLTVTAAEGEALGAGFTIEGGVDIGGFVGSLDESDRTVDVTVGIRNAMVGEELARHFPQHLREIREMLDLSGRTDADVFLVGGLSDIRTNATLRVHGVTAAYEGRPGADGVRRGGFPWRVDDLTGDITIVGSRVEWDARGVHGPASVHITGFTDVDQRGRSLTDVLVDASDVPLDSDLAAGFRDRAERTLGPWKPEGVAARLQVHVEQDLDVSDDDLATQIVATLDGRAAFVPHVMPVPLHDVHGVVHILEPVVDGARSDVVRLENVRANGDGFRATRVDGEAGPLGENLTIEFEVERTEGQFSDGLHASSVVPAGVKRTLTLLDPHGPMNVNARIVSRGEARDDRVAIDMRGLRVKGWEDVPLPVDDLVGPLVYENDGITTTGLRGTLIEGAPVHIAGSLTALSAERPRPDLVVKYSDARLDERLRDGLGTLVKDAAGVWDEIPPDRDFRADVTTTIRPADHPDGELSILIEKPRGGIRVLGLHLLVDDGRITYEKGVVRGGLKARRGAGELDVPLFTYWTASSDAEVGLSARGLTFPDDLVPLLSEEAAATIRETLAPSFLHLRSTDLEWDGDARRLRMSSEASLRPAARDAVDDGLTIEARLALRDVDLFAPSDGPVTFAGAAEVRDFFIDPGIEIDEVTGTARFSGSFGEETAVELSLEDGRARAAGLLVEDLALVMRVNGSRLRLPDITGSLYGGKLTARFNKGGERLAFRGAATVNGADLALYGEDQSKDNLEGSVDFDVRIRNPSGLPEDLEGTGTAEVKGAAVRIPFVTAAANAVDRALLGAASIEGEFHEGKLEFDLRGERMLIRDMNFDGPNVPLLLDATMVLRDGRGAINLPDGRLDLVISPRIEFGVLEYEPTGIFERVLGLAQFWLRRLRIEGTTRNPRTSWEVMSGSTDDEFKPRPRPIGVVRPYGPDPW